MNLWVDEDLLVLIEHARKKLGVDKSRFTRDAIVHYLKFLGYTVADTAGAPARDRNPIQTIVTGSNNAIAIGGSATVRSKKSK